MAPTNGTSHYHYPCPLQLDGPLTRLLCGQRSGNDVQIFPMSLHGCIPKRPVVPIPISKAPSPLSG